MTAMVVRNWNPRHQQFKRGKRPPATLLLKMPAYGGFHQWRSTIVPPDLSADLFTDTAAAISSSEKVIYAVIPAAQ
jgi:hypothetical protein